MAWSDHEATAYQLEAKQKEFESVVNLIMHKIYAVAGGDSGGMPRAGSHEAPNVEEVD